MNIPIKSGCLFGKKHPKFCFLSKQSKVSYQKLPLIVCIIMFIAINVSEIRAQIVGVNFNERIWEIDQDEIADSKASWARAFINITAFTTKQTVDGEITITGINQTKIDNYDAASLVSVSQMSSGSETINLIINLKYNFKDALGRVPTANGTEADILVEATKAILEKADLGDNVNILVVGNEPMWETPTDTASINHLEAFTNRIIDEVYSWKQDNSDWTYEIFAGAINKFSTTPNNKIRKRILNIAQTNSKVVGLDLHSHVSSTTEIVEDFRQLREDYSFTKELICTEFSIFGIFENHKTDALGTWGANNGYTSDMKLWEWINVLLDKANSGDPVLPKHFRSYFYSTSWYPQDWFQEFYNSFIDYDVKVATYGLMRSPDTDFVMTETSTTWVLNALRNEALLGRYSWGLVVRNPLCYPNYRDIVGPFDFAGTEVQVLSNKSGMSLDVAAGSTSDGGNIQQWTANGNLCQQWIFNFIKAGEYEIRSVKSDLAVEVANGLLVNGTNIQQATPNDKPKQRWLVQPLGDDQYRIISKRSKLAMEVAGNSETAGANVQQWTWNGNKGQKWDFSLVSSTKSTEESTEENNEVISDEYGQTSVFPNPATSYFTVSIPGNMEAQVAIYDILGNLIYQKDMVSGDLTFDTETFNSKFYIIQIKQSGNIITKKLIINK